jgi:glyoxylase-like metal-dependent hydrolase (beta-lactamase superfamily II)
MDLKQLTENVYYIPNVTNIGVIKDGDAVILDDSGIDDNAAKKILHTLESRQLKPKAIITTHYHADHCGGNAYLQNKLPLTVYAPKIEADIIQTPYLQPFALFSAANPPEALKKKYLLAKPSKVDHIIADEETSLDFDNVTVNVVRLLGHSPNQIGVEVEGVLFCADALFSEALLNKHKIPYLTDPDKQEETLAKLKLGNYSLLVPSHAEPTSEPASLADAYLSIIKDVAEFMTNNLDGGKRSEEILKAMCDHCHIKVETMQQFYLMNTVCLAFLRSLSNKGILGFEVKDNSLYWKTTNR